MGINYSYGTTKPHKLSNDLYRASYLDLYQKPSAGTSEYFFRVEEGGKIGQFYGYEYAGTDENHNMLVYAADGSKVTAASANPKTNVLSEMAPQAFPLMEQFIEMEEFRPEHDVP